MDWISHEVPDNVPAACVVQAARHYSVPLELVVSMLKVEGGKVGVRYPRAHGTYLGPSQVSDKWLTKFEPWGYTEHRIQHDGCANVVAGTYILAYYRAREPDWSRAIARYNVGSLNTPARISAGQRYAGKVLSSWAALHKKWGNLNATN
jgi:hypothetical protein